MTVSISCSFAAEISINELGCQKKFENKKIIFIGRLVSKKNIQNLLSAWKFVEENNDSNTLIILGDGPLLQELKTFAKIN